MHIVNGGASCLVLVLALTAVAPCESLALVSLPVPELSQDMFRAEVYPLDASFREFRLRPNGSPSRASYAGLIPVHEILRDRGSDRGHGSITRPGLGIRTVDGKVTQVNRRRNFFEIQSQSGERILISVPTDTQRSEIDRFRALRAGDYVKVEGRFLDRERFELENFI